VHKVLKCITNARGCSFAAECGALIHADSGNVARKTKSKKVIAAEALYGARVLYIVKKE